MVENLKHFLFKLLLFRDTKWYKPIVHENWNKNQIIERVLRNDGVWIDTK